MGKTVGAGSASQKQVKMKGVLGKHLGRYLDQYTFICVFGSVVGYAVMPLIGTIETLVLSVIVIGISINTVLRKNSPKEDERRRSKDEKKTKKQEAKKSVQVQVITDSESQHRRQKEEVKKTPRDLKTLAEDEATEKERRLEEKREKKARKREERNKRKEEEKKEKEREELARRERQEQRALKKQQEREAKEKAKGFLFPTYESIKALVTTQKPVRRERKHSASSTSSGSSSTYSHRSQPNTPPKDHHLPLRASSDPILYTGHVPWSPKSPESANLSFPHLSLTSNKSSPWSVPGHPSPHTVTSGTPHTVTSHGFEQAQRPPHFPTATAHSTGGIWGNSQVTLPSPTTTNHSVETLTPQQTWYSNDGRQTHYTNNFTTSSTSHTSTSSLWPGNGVWHDNRQQNGGFDSQVSSRSRFYSLFSNDIASPFVDFRSPFNGTACHPEKRLDGNNLAVTSNSHGNLVTDKGYDEWPNI